MNPLERAVRTIDRAQQRFGPAAFVYGVMKKFGDDRAGSLAALVAYYGFLSLFPALLLLVTILGLVAGSSSSLTHDVENSALSQFPVVGRDLGQNIHALRENSIPAFVVGILGLLWGSQGASQSAQHAMAEVWNIPGVVRPNFWARLARTGLLLVVLGSFLVVSTGLAGVSSFSGAPSVLLRAATSVGSLICNIALFTVSFRILTPKQISNWRLLPGAALGGFAYTLLQIFGTYLLDHQLRHSSQVYGFFAIVLGLIAFIYLAAEITMYMAEMNVVLARRLWPRSLVQPPLTLADEKVLAAITRQSDRRPEQHVSVNFESSQNGESRDERPVNEVARPKDG
jgi:YihY family inner membrane protein